MEFRSCRGRRKRLKDFLFFVYPVHLQQHAGFPLRVAEAGVREAGAQAQRAPLEAAHFLRHDLGVVLDVVLSGGAVLVHLLR